MTTFALAGFGFRAAAFHRVARALPQVRRVGAVALAIEQAADTGQEITTTIEAWSTE